MVSLQPCFELAGKVKVKVSSKSWMSVSQWSQGESGRGEHSHLGIEHGLVTPFFSIVASYSTLRTSLQEDFEHWKGSWFRPE
jgi:hypothetical protein